MPDTPLIGVHRGVGIYLLYNGILGDASEDGGNVLTRATLALIRAAIAQGVMKRALQGNASSEQALAAGRMTRTIAELGAAAMDAGAA